MIDLILLSVCSVSAFFWLVLLFMPVRWRMSERWEACDDSQAPHSQSPGLSVIVPARNERDSLPLTLPSWLNQDYPESEIILIDDESTDGTEACAHSISSQFNRTIRIIKGTLPPPGWTGKLWALQQGISISTGEWLLFTDADIRHCPNLWRGLVTKVLIEQREMVSHMAFLDTNGMWARLLIPAFVYFFHFMYPFEKVRDSKSKISAAAGGCVLISRRALDTIGGIAGHRNAIIDDLALARCIKLAGLCAFICQTVSPVTPIISSTTLLSMAGTYIPTIRFFGLGVCRALTLPLAGILYMVMTVSSAMNHLFGRHEWRGHRSRNAL